MRGPVIAALLALLVLSVGSYVALQSVTGYTLLTNGEQAHGKDVVARGIYLQRDGEWISEEEVAAFVDSVQGVAAEERLRALVLAELPMDLVGSGIELDDVELRITDGLPEGVPQDRGSSHSAVHGKVEGPEYLEPPIGGEVLMVVEIGCVIAPSAPGAKEGESQPFIHVGARWGTAPGYRDVDSLKRTVQTMAGQLVEELTAAAETAGLQASTQRP